MTTTIALIACSSREHPDARRRALPARDLYTGRPGSTRSSRWACRGATSSSCRQNTAWWSRAAC